MKKAPNECNTMSELRLEIDRLDRELMALLRERVDYIDRAAEIKQDVQLPARIDERVEEVVQNARRNAIEHGLDPQVAEKLWRKMINWSIEREEVKLGKTHECKNN